MTTREIISAFRQGGTGNCVSIAIIKAGIEIFGLNKIFHSEMVSENLFGVTMRDGFELQITKEELTHAALGSRFIPLNNQEIFEYANLCFAVMAKRSQLEKNDDFESMTFDQAIHALNNGEFYLEGPNWLGLRHHCRSIGRKFVFHYPGVVGASKKHCFFSSFGIEDVYGTPDRIHKLENRFCKWLRIAPDQVY